VATFLGEDDSVRCSVVVNDLGQYSIWPQERDVPAGWRTIGFNGSRDECLTHIETVWHDPTAPVRSAG
jgi:MbtH protein